MHADINLMIFGQIVEMCVDTEILDCWESESRLILHSGQFFNFYQQKEVQTTSSICSRDIDDLKILQPDWPRIVLPLSEEQDFSMNSA